MSKFQEKLGINEITDRKAAMWRALLAEFIGNLLLNFFGCGAVVSLNATPGVPPNMVLIALSFGLAVFMVICTIGHISGAHVNPAVTIAFLAAGKIKVVKAILYVIVQCLGSLAGSAMLRALTPENIGGNLGLTTVHDLMTPLQGFGIEFFLGFVLVLVVFGVCDENKPDSKFIAPLAIGLTITLGHLMAIDYTGSSMNPARSFGSAVVAANWNNHWVYWVGPILGGIAAALFYTQAFAAPKLEQTSHERYSTGVLDEKEMKRLDKHEEA